MDAAASQGRDALAKLPELETENVRLRNENAALKRDVEKAILDRDAAIAALRSPVGSQERADVEKAATDASTSTDRTVTLDNAEDATDAGKKPARGAGRTR